VRLTLGLLSPGHDEARRKVTAVIGILRRHRYWLPNERARAAPGIE
jgi:hypothetical protein